MESDTWAAVGLDTDQAARWETYARTGAGLASEEELEYIRDFVSQWQELTTAAEQVVIPKNAGVMFRVMILLHEIGGPQPVLYAAMAESEAADGQEQLFLIGRDDAGDPVGLVAAPIIAGLHQRIRIDGRYVEYVDSTQGRTLLYADAHQPALDSRGGEILTLILADLHQKLHPYVRSSLFPRYYFNAAGVEASFYTIEKLLTYSQIVQMTEAFELLDRPEFSPLKSDIFNGETSVTIIEGSDGYAGVTFMGTGVMQLDRRDLLGDKYLLVSVLAHEGAHILQPSFSDDSTCEKSLRREVGDYTVPGDFFDWSAETVLTGIHTERIGAYHVGFWVLNKLGVLGTKYYWPNWREIISTGKINDQWVSAYCE